MNTYLGEAARQKMKEADNSPWAEPSVVTHCSDPKTHFLKESINELVLASFLHATISPLIRKIEWCCKFSLAMLTLISSKLGKIRVQKWLIKCYFWQVCNSNTAVSVRCICEATAETERLTSSKAHPMHPGLKLNHQIRIRSFHHVIPTSPWRTKYKCNLPERWFEMFEMSAIKT